MQKLMILGCLVLISCGGSSSKKSAPPSVELACSKAASDPCGGNIVGTWVFVGVCNKAMTQQDVIDKYGGSSAACAVSGDVPAAGYAKFRDDGTYQIDEVDSLVLGFTEGCLEGKGKTCDGLNRKGQEIDAGEGVDFKASCVLSDNVCTCSLVPGDGADLGTYTLTGTSYRLQSDSLRPTQRDYCVQGDVLSIFAPSNAIGGAGTAILTRVADSTVPDIDASALDAKPDAGAIDASADTKTTDAPSDNAHRDAVMDAPADRPKADAVFDAPVVDAQTIDRSPIDSQPIDATPAPLEAMPPSTAAACAIAATAPCGGDLSGSWKISGICDPWLSETEYVASLVDCATQGDLPITGRSVFSVDGTCTLHQTIASEADFSVSCLAKAIDTCSARNQRYKNGIGTNDKTAASCVLSSSETCHCEEIFEFPTAGDACTYATSGTELTFVSPPDAFEGGAYDYCVQGDVLSIFIAPTSAAGVACDTCVAAYVLTRQN